MMDADRLASFYRPAEIQALRTDPVTAQHQEQLKMLNPASGTRFYTYTYLVVA